MEMCSSVQRARGYWYSTVMSGLGVQSEQTTRYAIIISTRNKQFLSPAGRIMRRGEEIER